MVDDKDNHVVDGSGKGRPAWEIPILLIGAFRVVVDEAHELLAVRGHPGVRPMHGFALQAIGAGATASELGQRLGVSKQAAAKTITVLLDAGYVERESDPADARRLVVRSTARGADLLEASARAFAEVVAGWEEQVGAAAVTDLHSTLRRLVGTEGARTDVAGWLG